MPVLGVLVAPLDADPGTPEARPIGRAALLLEGEGVPVVFGHEARDGRLIGVRARPGAWTAAECRVDACYDRFPSQTRPDAYAALRAGLGSVAVANPTAQTLLCRDKLASQRVLEAAELRLPEVEADPAAFADRLAAWGTAYLKPRFGAFGRGVRRVVPGDALPARGEGAVPGVEEPLLLQRAVPPPEGWAGVSVRVLCQRTAAGWHPEAPVARRSRDDWVVNAARGAEVVPAAELGAALVAELQELAVATARALAREEDGSLLCELGLDAVIDDRGRPWIVEVNSRPRGRLEHLAGADPAVWWERHVRACARPLRFLLAHRGE